MHESPDEIQRENDRDEGASSRRDASGPAIAATAALVLFSVFIGVFGPRLGNRQQSPAGVTLVELAEAVVTRTQPQWTGEIFSRSEEISDEQCESELDRITASGVPLPSLESLDFAAVSVQRVRLPGGSGALVKLNGIKRNRGDVAAIAVVLDEDRFTVYDRYSRPVALPRGEVFSVEDRLTGADGTVEVFRQGEFVIAVVARTRETALELVAALQAAHAERLSRGAT